MNHTNYFYAFPRIISYKSTYIIVSIMSCRVYPILASRVSPCSFNKIVFFTIILVVSSRIPPIVIKIVRRRG